MCFSSGSNDRRDAFAFSAVDFGTGIAHIVDDAFSARHILLCTVFGTTELSFSGKNDFVGFFVLDDPVSSGMYPFVNAGRFRVALLLEAGRRPCNGCAAIALRGDGEFDTCTGEMDGTAVNDDVAGIDGRLLHFVAVELVGMHLDRLLIVRAESPGGRGESGCKKTEN